MSKRTIIAMPILLAVTILLVSFFYWQPRSRVSAYTAELHSVLKEHIRTDMRLAKDTLRPAEEMVDLDLNTRDGRDGYIKILDKTESFVDKGAVDWGRFLREYEDLSVPSETKSFHEQVLASVQSDIRAFRRLKKDYSYSRAMTRLVNEYEPRFDNLKELEPRYPSQVLPFIHKARELTMEFREKLQELEPSKSLQEPHDEMLKIYGDNIYLLNLQRAAFKGDFKAWLQVDQRLKTYEADLKTKERELQIKQLELVKQEHQDNIDGRDQFLKAFASLKTSFGDSINPALIKEIEAAEKDWEDFDKRVNRYLRKLEQKINDYRKKIAV